MDYEKIYKESFRLAKDWHADPSITERERVLLESIYPQLKPNKEDLIRQLEDEKTRQELLTFIKAEKEHTPETTPGEHWDRWIAYLERQKEQKKSLSERFRPDFPAVAEFIESVDDLEKNRAIGILEDYLKWAVSSEVGCPYTWKELADAIQLGIDAMKEQQPANRLTLENPLTGEKVYEREIPEFMKGQDPKDAEAIIHLTAKGWTVIAPGKEQQPAEWREEDEKILNCIINVLERLGFEEYCKSSRDQDVEEERFYYKEIQVLKKLKSLRPQSHWKPSKEQMEALNALNCHGGLSYVGQQEHLISLYNDIKKL